MEVVKKSKKTVVLLRGFGGCRKPPKEPSLLFAIKVAVPMGPDWSAQPVVA